ncbi:MAG: hypothetical protein K5675_04620 [Lachnospiraceae bacterium]|nr:hypothetical protein [Lachnospiraceae bacterium]
MDEHLSLEDIERYLSDDLDNTPLDWFQKALEHVMSCKKCQKRISKHYKIERLFDEDGQMLALGLEELAKGKSRMPVFVPPASKENNNEGLEGNIFEFGPVNKDGVPVNGYKSTQTPPVSKDPEEINSAANIRNPQDNMDYDTQKEESSEDDRKKNIFSKILGWIRRK